MKALFYGGGSLSEWLRRRDYEAENATHAQSSDRVLGIPEADLVNELSQLFAVEPLELGSPYSPGPRDVEVDVRGDFLRGTERSSGPVYVRGTRIEVRVPYTGNPELWDLQASQSTTRLPRGDVRGGELVLTLDEPADTLRPETFRDRINGELDNIRRFLAFTAADCDQYNRGLPGRLAGAVAARKQKALLDRQVTEFLPVAIKPRGPTDPAISVALPRRRNQLADVAATTNAYVPEPAISSQQYSAILQAIRDWALAVERLPETFGPMPEEALRDNLLVSLNGQFGASGAETFSRTGKTDILIQQPNGAVFIAECKFWDGPTAFKEAVDQLLGYLVWRDTKSALIVFVRTGDVTSVIAKANGAIASHQRYKRQMSMIAGHTVHVLHHEKDVNREIEVALVVVAMPETAPLKRVRKPSRTVR